MHANSQYDRTFIEMQWFFGQLVLLATQDDLPKVLSMYTCLEYLVGTDGFCSEQWVGTIQGLPVDSEVDALHDLHKSLTASRPLRRTEPSSWIMWRNEQNGAAAIDFVGNPSVGALAVGEVRRQLREAAEEIADRIGPTTAIEFRSWLLGTGLARRLLPTSILGRLKESRQPGTTSLVRWGQFLDKNNNSKARHVRMFYGRMDEYVEGRLHNLMEVFPMKVFECNLRVSELLTI